MRSLEANITGYGVYIPRYRVPYVEFERAWQNKELILKTGPRLGIQAKAVTRLDEDAVTMAVEAAHNAMKAAAIEPNQVGAIIVASGSSPYRGKSISSIVARALGFPASVISLDINEGAKSGTTSLIVGKSMIDAGTANACLVIASDCLRTEPGSQLEPTMGAGSAAFVLEAQPGVASIRCSANYTNESYDFWGYPEEIFMQYDPDMYTNHYIRAVAGASDKLIQMSGSSASDYPHAIFQQPNGKLPIRTARQLGFSQEQLTPGLIVSKIGDTLSASCLLALAHVLDQATEGDRILLASYGSGCSDALEILVAGDARPSPSPSVMDYIDNGIEITYVDYLRNQRLLPKGAEVLESIPTTTEILHLNSVHYRPSSWVCAGCGFSITTEQKICPQCKGRQWHHRVSQEAQGTIHAVSEITNAPGPFGKENQNERYVVAMVDVDNHGRITAQCTDFDGVQLKIGVKVETVFRKYRSQPAPIYGYKFRVPLVIKPRQLEKK